MDSSPQDQNRTQGCRVRAFLQHALLQSADMAHETLSRARYLRLPTSVPRQSALSQPSASLAPAPRTIFPSRPTTRARSPLPSRLDPPAAGPSVARGRLGLTSLLTSRPHARSPERPKFSSRTATAREPSPVGAVSASVYRDGIAAWRAEIRPLKSAPSTVAGDERDRDRGRDRDERRSERGGGKSSLWQELREVRKKSRSRAGTVTERTCSPEPP